MAAGAWTLFNKAKKKIGNTTINLGGTNFRITLHTSAFANAATLSTYASVGSEVSEANGYSSSGKALTSVAWTVGTSAGQYKWDVGDVTWTGTGGSIANIKFAVIWKSGASANARHVICRSQLTSSQFTLASGNTLTLQMATAGVFTLA